MLDGSKRDESLGLGLSWGVLGPGVMDVCMGLFMKILGLDLR